MNGAKGFTLPELVIAGAIGLTLVFALSVMFVALSRELRNSRNKASFVETANDIDAVLHNPAVCPDSLRSGPAAKIKFDPPPDISLPYTADVAGIYIGNEVWASGPALSLNQPDAQHFRVQRLQLIRVPGIPARAGRTAVGTPAVTIDTSTYLARLELEALRTAGTLNNQRFNRSWLMNVTVDPATQMIVTCEAVVPKFRVYTAVAKRLAATIAERNCREGVPNNRWIANACTDANLDRRCDSDPLLATIEHPYKTSQPDFWDRSIPSRQSGVNPVAPQDEGRCLVSVRMNTSTEPPDRIFILRNGDYPAPEGIGCNRANGWNLISCTRSDWGSGDSDTDYSLDSAGNPACVTNDHTQPHFGGRAFAIQSVGVTAVCMKFEMN